MVYLNFGDIRVMRVMNIVFWFNVGIVEVVVLVCCICLFILMVLIRKKGEREFLFFLNNFYILEVFEVCSWKCFCNLEEYFLELVF